ncbi:MAG: acyl-CoA thioesterase, partial [Bacillota bacterium]
MKYYQISHLVKSEDLNHHGTLFAGRSAEWLVEAAFVAAASQHGR